MYVGDPLQPLATPELCSHTDTTTPDRLSAHEIVLDVVNPTPARRYNSGTLHTLVFVKVELAIWFMFSQEESLNVRSSMGEREEAAATARHPK